LLVLHGCLPSLVESVGGSPGNPKRVTAPVAATRRVIMRLWRRGSLGDGCLEFLDGPRGGARGDAGANLGDLLGGNRRGAVAPRGALVGGDRRDLLVGQVLPRSHHAVPLLALDRDRAGDALEDDG